MQLVDAVPGGASRDQRREIVRLQYRHSWRVWGFSPNAMHRIASSDKANNTAALAKRLWNAANPFPT